MKFWDIFKSIAAKFKNGIQAIFGRVFKKATHENSVNLKGVSPKGFKYLLRGGFFLFILFMIVLYFTNKATVQQSGADLLNKEMTPSAGVANSSSDPLKFGIKPLELDSKGDNNPLINIKDADTPEGKGLKDKSNDELTQLDCMDLLDKLKKSSLGSNEKDKMQTCIDKNIGQFSEKDKEIANALNKDGLSDNMKKNMRKCESGELDASSPECQVISQFLDGNPKAKAGMACMDNFDKKCVENVASNINGNEPSAAAKKQIDDAQKEFDKKVKDNSTKNVTENNDVTNQKNSTDNGGAKESSGPNDVNDIKNLANDIDKKTKEKNEVDNKLKIAEQNAKTAAQKIGQGKSSLLTKAEQDALKQISELNQKSQELKKEQEAKRNEYEKKMAKLNQSLIEASMKVKRVMPTGISAHMIAGKRKDKEKIKRSGKTIVENKDIYVDFDGTPLSPDKIKIVELIKKQKYQLERSKKNLRNPLGSQNFADDGYSVLGYNGTNGVDANGNPILVDANGNPINNAKIDENGNIIISKDKIGGKSDLVASNDTKSKFGQNVSALPFAPNSEVTYQIKDTRVIQDKALKKFQFTPDMKIPAVLNTEIIQSQKEKAKRVEGTIITDIIDSQTNQIIVPKGSKVIGATGSFDKDTYSMDIKWTKIVVGGGNVLDVDLTTGSADGSMGLKGKVYDTRTQYLAGAFVTAFANGALSWFSQQVVEPFQTSTSAGQALSGAGLSGGAEVMRKLSEMYASDLQNAPQIFWCKKKVPLILYPN